MAMNLKRSPIIICRIGESASTGIDISPVSRSPWAFREPTQSGLDRFRASGSR